MLGLLTTSDSAPFGSAPCAPGAALNTAAHSPLFASATSANGSAGSALMAERYIYALDVPISSDEVKTWRQTLELVPSLAETAAVDSASRFWSAEAVATVPTAGDEQQAYVHKLAPCPAFDAAAVVALPMTKVLRTRREWLPYRQRFPVHQARIALLDAVLNHDVVTLIGPSGSGRTLQLPLMLAETDVFKRRRTVVVVANAVAARLTVRRLREERGEDVESSRTVGFVLPTESEATKGTSIVVTTADVLVRQLTCDALLQGVGCVIFDDAHLRSEVTELCFAAMRTALLAQRSATAAAAAAGATAEAEGVPTTAGADSVRVLRVVINCPDESCAAPLLGYFKANGAVSFTLPVSAAAQAPEPVVLHVDEAVCWLAKCDKDGSQLCTQPDQQLASWVENVDVVARVLAASESDFSSDVKRRQYWVPLLAEALRHYDQADRQLRQGAGEPSGALPLAMVVAPDLHTQMSLESELKRVLLSQADDEEAGEASRAFAFLSLPSQDRACAAHIERLVAGKVVATPGAQRVVVLCTPDLAQSALPYSLQVGLVLDCARVAYATTDPHTMSDLWSIEYAAIQNLRYRRTLGRLAAPSGNGAQSPAPMVLQLIPKRILHSAQHRRQSADPTHHTLFRLPFDRYVQLYQLLQAREEAMACQLSTHDAVARTLQQQSLPSKISQLAASLFVAVPPATSDRYGNLRRSFTQVEAHLVAAGHVDIGVPRYAPDVVTYGRLKSLGVATTCVPLPAAVTRLMCLGAALDCTKEATLVAALLLVGDLFSTSTDSFPSDPSQAALLAEVRQYFSSDSKSDVVVAFNVYKMWCETCAGPAAEATATEAEQAFLDECGASRAALLSIQHLHAHLYCLSSQLFALQMDETQMVPSPALHGELVATVRGMPESPLASGPLVLCLTGALYPSCVVPQSDGSAFLLQTAAGNTNGTKRVGVFAEASLLSDPTVAAACSGKPFLFARKTALSHAIDKASVAAEASAPQPTSTGEHTVSRMLNVLSALTPLRPSASILLCGEGTEDVRPLPRRCRGWRPALSGAWRRTRLARALPPPSQLPTPSVTVVPYDTVRADQVMVSTDCTFHYAMRQTTSRWLMQLRRSLQRQLSALTLHRVPAGDDTNQQLAGQLAAAWSWYEAREHSGKDWLREERARLSRAAAAGDEEGNGADGDGEGTAQAVVEKPLQTSHKLFGFFHFATTAGVPSVVTAPTVSAAEVERSAAIAARAEQLEAAAPRPSAGGDGGFTVITGADAHRVPDVYTGKRPHADEEEIFRMCVESVAESRSRSAEAELLRDKPKMFAFLDPDNEFHAYYLFLLRQRAPDLEVLGDNIEELIEFLEALEDEVRGEAGLPTREEMAAAAAQEEEDGFDDEEQWDVVDPNDEAMEGQEGSNFFETGLQVETDALSLQKPVAPSFSRPATSVGTSKTNAEGSASLLSAPSSGMAADGQTNQTLMERLMSMAKPVDSNTGSAAGHLPFVAPSTNAAVSAAAPSAADLLALMDACMPLAPATPSDPSALHADGHHDETADGSAPVENPLARPPPPIPVKDIEERVPSIVVYPLPDRKYDNIALILTKALGETLDVRVGPTKIVGNVARISVPNRQVELRALAEKRFMCLGQPIYIFKNDRVIDNPNPVSRRRPRPHDALPALPGAGSLFPLPPAAAGVLGDVGYAPAAAIGGILGDRPSGWMPTAPLVESHNTMPAAPQVYPVASAYNAYYPQDTFTQPQPPVKFARAEEAAPVKADDDEDEQDAFSRAPVPIQLDKLGVISDDDDDDDSSSSSDSSATSEEEGEQ